MINLPTYDTEMTRDLNLEIARKSKGVCFLMFSHGKDSLVAWMNLKRYFKRIIPFHCSSFPLSKYQENTLRYYEEEFGEHIIRLVGEEVSMGTARGMYQTPDMLDGILDMEVEDYSKLDILEELRYQYNLPGAWCAVGLNMCDSIDRRIHIKKCGGRHESNRTFYPTADWDKKEIINALQQSGLKLSSEYRWASRTMGGVPSYTCLRILREHYPEDYERHLAIWPLAEAKSIRERYLDRAWAARKESGIVDDEVSCEGNEFDDGSDVMPGFGMEE